MRKAQPERIGTERIGSVPPDPVAGGVPEQRRPTAGSMPRGRDGETSTLPPVAVPVLPDGLGASAQARPRPETRRRGGQRRATFTIVGVRPWSLFRLGLCVGAALFVCWMVGLIACYVILQRAGMWDRLNGTLSDLLRGSGYDTGSVVTFGRAMAVGGAVGVVSIVLLAGFIAACALVYNFCSELAGGIELTLAEPAHQDTPPAGAGRTA
jgi:Transmembrane domain of unknown function (DUF3566)